MHNGGIVGSQHKRDSISRQGWKMHDSQDTIRGAINCLRERFQPPKHSNLFIDAVSLLIQIYDNVKVLFFFLIFQLLARCGMY